MRKVFLDVGGHRGETLEAVLSPELGFDWVVCFEPVGSCCREIADRFQDARLQLCRFGLWRESCSLPLYAPGMLGGSIHSELNGVRESELCQFEDVDRWFRRNVTEQDIVWIKLNCEGAECDIVNRLIDTREFYKISYLMIDFDVRKIPGQQHREFDLKERFRQLGLGFPRVGFCDDVMQGPTHADRIRNWLRLTGLPAGGG